MSSMIACASALDMGAWTTADLLFVPRTFAPMASTDTERITPVNTPNANTHIAWNVDMRLTPLAAMRGIVSLNFPPAWLPHDQWITSYLLPILVNYEPDSGVRAASSRNCLRMFV